MYGLFTARPYLMNAALQDWSAGPPIRGTLQLSPQRDAASLKRTLCDFALVVGSRCSVFGPPELVESCSDSEVLIARVNEAVDMTCRSTFGVRCFTCGRPLYVDERSHRQLPAGDVVHMACGALLHRECFVGFARWHEDRWQLGWMMRAWGTPVKRKRLMRLHTRCPTLLVPHRYPLTGRPGRAS